LVSDECKQSEDKASVSIRVGANVFGLVGEIEVRGSACKEATEMLRECLDIVKAEISKPFKPVIKITTWITTRIFSRIERIYKVFLEGGLRA
jgi:hypothetical protein